MTPTEYAAYLRRQPARERERLTRVFQGALAVVWECLTVGNARYGSPGTPVDTGFARASWFVGVGGLGTPPTLTKPAPGSGTVLPVATVALTGATLDQPVYFANGAAYAVPLELGHSGQAPVGWVRLTALAWPQIVRDVAARVGSLPRDAGPGTPAGAGA